jgi:hypothetical protein
VAVVRLARLSASLTRTPVSAAGRSFRWARAYSRMVYQFRRRTIQAVWLVVRSRMATWSSAMPKLAVSWARRPDHDDNPFQVLWSLFCWATAFGAVAVTTAALMR